MRIRLAGTRRGWKKMLPPIERGRLNEQVLIAPVLRTPAPSWSRMYQITDVTNSAGDIGSVPIRNAYGTSSVKIVRAHRLVEGESLWRPTPNRTDGNLFITADQHAVPGYLE